MAPLAAALVLVGVGLAGCTAGLGDAFGGGVDADGLFGVGSTWTLEGRTHGMDFRDRYVVTEEVERHGERAYVVEAVFSAQQGTDGYERFHTVWLRVGDRAMIEDQSSHYGVLDNGISVDQRSRTLRDPPCPDAFGRDLSVGLEWTATCFVIDDGLDWSSARGYESRRSSHNRTESYKVEAQETVTVAAGTFSAYRINTTEPHDEEGTWSTIWVSDQVCGTSRHPVVKFANVDHDGHESEGELAESDCDGSPTPPWKGEGPRRWAPPLVVPAPDGWPDNFAPGPKELGDRFVYAPTIYTGPDGNRHLAGPGEHRWDSSAPLETYRVVYIVEGSSDTIRLTASRFENETYPGRYLAYPIHEVPEECDYDPKATLAVGAIAIQLDGSYEPHDGKDTSAVLAQGMANLIRILEDRVGVEATSCQWTPLAETSPTPASSSTSTTAKP